MFRPCIDLHEGRVKQIVGGTLGGVAKDLKTHFVSELSAAYYADLYRRDALKGGHVIRLGPGNTEAAVEALQAYPGGLQVGGGIRADNAAAWLERGASHVIVTSWVFREGRVDFERLDALRDAVGRDHLVLDLSCRRQGDDYFIVTDRWRRLTELTLSAETLRRLSAWCQEFLIHAVDKEGLRQGVDLELVAQLTDWTPIPITYAGGARSLEDLEAVTREGKGRVDLTIGSALDIFGGQGVRYVDAVAFNRGLQLPS